VHYPLPGAGDCQHLQLPRSANHLLGAVPVSPDPPFQAQTNSADLCRTSAFVILFIEVPFLLRICPTSPKFDGFIRRFTTNWMRAAMYTILSGIQWASLCDGASSLIAAAVVLLIAALFYALAGLKSQEFIGSKTLGGQGVAQMIV
jgi:Uncharacterized conserved protein CG6151-P